MRPEKMTSNSEKAVTLCEYGYLGFESGDGIEQISESAFIYLEGLALSEEDERKLFQFRKKNYQKVLQVQNYAGVILTPDGTQIEILPKIGRERETEEEIEKARSSLLIMLKALGTFDHLKTENAEIEKQKKPLLEIFISQFLQSVKTLVRQGLRSDYVPREDSLFFCKGKLDLKQQLRQNFIQKQRFYCHYDEFLLDRPANRLIKSALLKVRHFMRESANQKMWQELRFVFDEIPESRNVQSDFSALKMGRGMAYYDVPLKWCRLILEGFTPLTMKGKNNAFSLLFPMEKVFESYVEKMLKKHVPVSYWVKGQARQHYLTQHNNKDFFLLKPDLLLKNKDEKTVFILDTKCKLLSEAEDKYGISQSDFYQMFAYGNTYFETGMQERKMFLIYPSHKEFELNEKIQDLKVFNFPKSKGLQLFIVPFEIKPANEKPNCLDKIFAELNAETAQKGQSA
ncbi:restriction endonuclease [Acetobacteraceae bacterium]|nr:restriction endonuclease [Acetobacteraceae bacterium]